MSYGDKTSTDSAFQHELVATRNKSSGAASSSMDRMAARRSSSTRARRRAFSSARAWSVRSSSPTPRSRDGTPPSNRRATAPIASPISARRTGPLVDGTRIVEVYVRGGETVRFGGTTVRLETDLSPLVPEPLPSAVRFGQPSARASRCGVSTCLREALELADPRDHRRRDGHRQRGARRIAPRNERLERPLRRLRPHDGLAISGRSRALRPRTRSFTGAAASRPGVFEEADGGTL